MVLDIDQTSFQDIFDSFITYAAKTGWTSPE